MQRKVPVCIECGQAFEYFPGKKYCCERCKRRAKEYRMRHRISAAKRKSGTEKHSCPVCGRIFYAGPVTVYCSGKCRAKAKYRRRKSGGRNDKNDNA